MKKINFLVLTLMLGLTGLTIGLNQSQVDEAASGWQQFTLSEEIYNDKEYILIHDGTGETPVGYYLFEEYTDAFAFWMK